MFFDRQNPEITEKQSVSSDKISGSESRLNGAESSTEENEQNKRNYETYENRETPIIYQRESF